jgi:hypothetical protein
MTYEPKHLRKNPLALFPMRGEFASLSVVVLAGFVLAVTAIMWVVG